MHAATAHDPEGHREYSFVKGHGTRNDFVLLDDPDGALDLDVATVAALADRRGGIGADGVIRVVRTRAAGVDAPADAPEWFMDYRNADGSLAEMCGNGVRVFGAHLRAARHIDVDEITIWTRAGIRSVRILERPSRLGDEWRVRVGMGAARLEDTGRVLHVAGRTLPALDVDMGNPHTVAELPDDLPLEQLDLTRRPGIEPDPPAGTNMEFVAVRGPRHVAMRVFERGVGETESCGTGVAATAVAAAHRAGDSSRHPWRVDVPGGTLHVGWEGSEVTLTGPARLVATGTVHL